ncbi:glycoside hydrolase superfamily [Mycena sp. CBHHK59/15]|nr:glycoside hydrolase superfamily [Mycena sp. CBHHK59/15]
MHPDITVTGHTTASTPCPHILYTFAVDRDAVFKKSDEEPLTHATRSSTPSTRRSAPDLVLPPERLLVTTFVPSARADDALIAERKAGLGAYLAGLVKVPEYRHSDALQAFLAPTIVAPPRALHLEDALPSTLSRKTAQELSVITAAAISFIAAAYYSSWSADSYPPEKLNYSKFDILFFGKVLTMIQSSVRHPQLLFHTDLGLSNSAMQQRLVSSAKRSGKGAKVVLSVGGWLGSASFHQIAGSSTNRTKFVLTLSSAVSKFGLDGIDVDWEYPNGAGAGNAYGSADVANLLFLLKVLRTSLGTSMIISAAVTDLPWIAANGSPFTDVSAYAAQLSYVTCPVPTHRLGICEARCWPAYTAQAAFKQWTAAKFPASKLLLGLPLYGYVFNSTKTRLTPTFVESGEVAEAEAVADAGVEAEVGEAEEAVQQAEAEPEASVEVDAQTVEEVIAGTAETTEEAIEEAGKEANVTDGGAVSVEQRVVIFVALTRCHESHQMVGPCNPFNSLVASDALVKLADGTYGEGGGFKKGWDNCSDTPFLYNTTQKTVLSYDVHTLSQIKQLSPSQRAWPDASLSHWIKLDDGVTLQNAIRKA